MLLNHDELLLLSRGGRVPRAERAHPRPIITREPRPRLIDRLSVSWRPVADHRSPARTQAEHWSPARRQAEH